MSNVFEKALGIIEEISELQYRMGQSVLDQLNQQTQNTDNGNLTPIVKGSLGLLNTAVEGRHTFEKAFLSMFKSGLRSTSDAPVSIQRKDTSGARPSRPNGVNSPSPVINTGTIFIKAVPTQKHIDVPLNLNNKFAIAQSITVEVPNFINMETGTSVSKAVMVDQAQLSLAPESESKINVHIDLQEGYQASTRYYTTLIIRGREIRLFQIVLEILTGKDKKEQTSVSFIPVEQ